MFLSVRLCDRLNVVSARRDACCAWMSWQQASGAVQHNLNSHRPLPRPRPRPLAFGGGGSAELAAAELLAAAPETLAMPELLEAPPELLEAPPELLEAPPASRW
jgi:hypothetical protein